jgi:microcystin-dependent protein
VSEPFLGEIRIVAFNFPPRGWAYCNGQTLPIAQNQALFALLGTTYGGNGQTTFALPNLQGRAPMHFGTGFTLGQQGGEEAHTLIASEMPAHTHALPAQSQAAQAGAGPAGNASFAASGVQPYRTGASQTVAAQSAVGATGGGQPHENRPPFLVVSFCIAMQGIFPSRN